METITKKDVEVKDLKSTETTTDEAKFFDPEHPKPIEKKDKISRQQRISNRAKSIGKVRFIKMEIIEDFKCRVCKGVGKNANVFHDKAGRQILVGNTCLKYFGLHISDVQDMVENSIKDRK